MQRKQALAAAILLTALSSTLFALANPAGPAGATDPGLYDFSNVVAAATCQPGTSTPAEVNVRFLATDATGLPLGAVGSALRVTVAVGEDLSALQFSPSGPPPLTVDLTGAANVWLPAPAPSVAGAPQSVFVQVAGGTAQTVSLQPCDPSLVAPAQIAFVAPTVTVQSQCAADGTSIAITPTLANPNADPALLAAFNSQTQLTELDNAVLITDGQGQLVYSGVGSFPFTPATSPSDIAPSVALPSATLTTVPNVAPFTGWTVSLIDAQGNLLPDPTDTAALDATPACPAPVVVVPPPTPTDTPTSVSESTPDTSAPSTSDSTSASPSASDTASSSAPPVVPPTTPAVSPTVPVSAPITSEPVIQQQPTIAPSSSAKSSPPLVVTSPSPTITSGLAFSNPATPTSTSPADRSNSPAITIAPSASISFSADRQLADSSSTLPKPVQILRWHSDAALVVGFDAMAIFSLVGATVWSARRR